jgi:CRP/FNR family transcriptional regulator
MLDAASHYETESQATPHWNLGLPPGTFRASMLLAFEPRRRLVRPKAHIFSAGQAAGSIYLINSGVIKTSVASEDGREKITGFRMRGDLLGLDSFGLESYACDAIALSIGEVWEYSRQQLFAAGAACQQQLATALAREIRRDWDWMLATATLTAEQRVVSFLLEMAARAQALGCSGQALTLPMSRSEAGNYLALQLETVVRAMSKLQALGLISIDGREIGLRDVEGLRALLARPGHSGLRAAA